MDQKQRQSGIELLRLVAMFGIVLSHWGGHGSWVVNNDNTFIVNKVFLQLTQYFGEIGNCVFVLITGYFCANNIEVNKKGVLRVITDVKVYAILMFVISICIGMTEFSISGGVKCLLPIVYPQYWFVPPFLVVLLLTPWINQIIAKSDSKTLIYYFSILVMVEWILPMALAPTVSSNIGHMILVYSIGCMIRNQRISPSWQAYITNRRIQILTFIVGLASAILILMALDYGLPAVGRTITTSTYLTFIGRFSIMPIIASLGLFFLFLNMQLSSRYINYISRSAFAVYLISENPNIYPWFWKSCFDNIDYYKSTSMIPIALAQCVVVFVGCVLIDIVYRLLKSHVYQLGNIKQ